MTLALNTIIRLSLALTTPALSATIWAQPLESWYQKVWCEGMGGKVEYRLKDGRRIDCLTDQHAIEIEFARKWPEAIGQPTNIIYYTENQAWHFIYSANLKGVFFRIYSQN